MFSTVFRKGVSSGISRPFILSGQRNRHLITSNRKNINRYLDSTRNSPNICSLPKLSPSSQQATPISQHVQLGGKAPAALFQSFKSSQVHSGFPSMRTPILESRNHQRVFLLKNQSSELWRQQISSFHTSRPNQLPAPLVPAVLFTLKTPVTALVLRMVSRVSLTLLPLSAKQSPKVVLTLVAIPPICFALVIFAGLEAAPNTGRWRFLFTSEEEELAMLQEEIPVFMESIKVLDEDDPRVQLVRHILKNLLSTSIERDGSTLRTGIVEKLEKRHEAQQRLKEEQQLQHQNITSEADTSSSSEDSTIQTASAAVATKAIVSTQKPVSTNAPVTPTEEEEDDPELADISFEDRPFQIFVSEDDTINAFSLGPPRLIYINSGLMDWLENDEDLVAAVVAHELAHVIQRHTMETHGRETVMLFVADLLRSAFWTVSIPLGPWFNSWVDDTTNKLLHFTASGPLHQRIEVEADTVSLTLMALAGYDPMHSVRLWELWADKDKREMDEQDSEEVHKWTDWMYDHPPSAERAKYLKEAVMPAREMWEKVLHRRKEPVKRFLSLENRLNSQVDEDGDLKEGTVEDILETMDELLKEQEEEERNAKKYSGFMGFFRKIFKPLSGQDADVGSAEPVKA
ncbi:hypothetical protein BGX27_009715 [Mortierella sp. AM989]|nr:hypothetical protein BGX27_009715 [Mortierella sp. AM989]